MKRKDKQDIYNIYFNSKKYYYLSMVIHTHEYLTYKYVYYLRREENSRTKIIRLWYRRKKNKLGEKIGFTIPAGVFGKGLHIWHIGNIVVNTNARVGDNCILHGDNCIGNNGISGECPVIGNNVDVGVGAKIIGNVKIADGVKIGAGAIVIKDCLRENATLVGVPAKEVK